MATTAANVLNVTLLEPRMKHPTIFARFDELNKGEHLIILNDHDPRPLYYQLLSARGNIFTWEYLEAGPEWWRIRITIPSTTETNETLGELAAQDIRKAQVFRKYGLDFCCGGKKTVRQACAEAGVNPEVVEQELRNTESITGSRPLPYNEWSPDFLADYIVNTHHSYVRKNYPDIRMYADKVMRVHGGRHPELVEVHLLVEENYTELMSHMEKEEQILFPYIKHITAVKNGTATYQAPHFGEVKNPIAMMEHDHEAVGNNLHAIRKYTNGFTLPEDACASYSLLFRMLEEMEEDLLLHIHLENNLLFPQALEIEKSIQKS